MKNMNLLIATLTLSGPGSGSTGSAPPGTVYQRRENQQDRIANGISNGQLTAGETSNLETQGSQPEQADLRRSGANGGSLTNQEKNQINRRQNNLSNQIYADKHNNVRPQYGANQVDARRLNQQSRIAQGIRSGQMTAGERPGWRVTIAASISKCAASVRLMAEH